jgi:hypothetical protein
MSPGAQFRAAVAESAVTQVVGVVNAYAARLAEASGFRALYLSGGGVAACSCGIPDLGMTTLEDVLTDLRRLRRVTELPLLVDIDTGWGDVATAVREMSHAGAAAVHLEDQVDQKRCGHRPGKVIVSQAEMADRIHAAVEARIDDNFVIMARTDALAVEGLDAALERAQAYSKGTGNSGIQVRSRYDHRAGWLDGPQVDIHPPGPWRCGFIYDETRSVKEWISPITGKPRVAKVEHAPEGWRWFHADMADLWNEVRIVCRGTRIKTIVNGVVVADYDGTGHLDDAAHKAYTVGMKGHISLQIHPGGPMLIRFKDIQLRKL